MPDAAVMPYPSHLLMRPHFSWDLSRSTSPTLPTWTLSSISNAGVTATATRIFRVPDCNLRYQTKATLTAEICSVG